MKKGGDSLTNQILQHRHKITFKIGIKEDKSIGIPIKMRNKKGTSGSCSC